MKVFAAFVRKEFFHIFRDVRTMLILLLMPLIQILLLGFALSTEVKNIHFATLNLAKNELSAKLTQAFSENAYFEFARELKSEGELKRVFNGGKIDLVIVMGANFSATNAKVQFLIDASEPNRADTINLYANNVLSSFFKANLAGLSGASALNFTHPASLSPLNIYTTLLFNPQGKSAYTFVPGVLGLIMMLICAMMTSISIVREKEFGSMEVLLVSPVRPLLIILAKLVPYFCISCVSLSIALFVSVFALGIEIKGSLALLFAFCMLYIALTLSIGLFVSNIAKTQIVAMLVSGMLFMVPIIVFSGMIFPIESMPMILQYFSHIIPTKWFILGVKKIMIEGLGAFYVLQEVAILCFMLFLILFISLKSFKIRLE